VAALPPARGRTGCVWISQISMRCIHQRKRRGVGNPNPDLDGTNRKGDNLYTDSIVALNAKTGKLAWHYREVKHDVWDYDAISNVMLFDAKDDKGNTVPAAGEAGKVGWSRTG
jgi:glucose dehydrogenase